MVDTKNTNPVVFFSVITGDCSQSKGDEMNGFDFLAGLRSDDRYRELRVIILTSPDEIDNEIEGVELGATDYIRKPISGEMELRQNTGYLISEPLNEKAAIEFLREYNYQQQLP
ncbi:MAG TPA: response regulator [Mesotoga sp.]|nr:response regulator [Mesotoga sp.]HPM94637.1 response regulator [Mesotoga sp.]HPX21786.1 response regulator [Mesotoga sp.]HQQ56539.1 response regulator [Mesotoga sp.]